MSASTLRRRFGNWEKALAAAGLNERLPRDPLSTKTKQQRGKGVSRETLLMELRRIARELGSDTVRTDEFNRLSPFEEGVIRRRFGSWNAALRAAELTIAPMGRRYSDDECFENLLRVWTHYGRAPLHREMDIDPSVVGPKAYIKRWGTWNKSLHAFVERVNRDIGKEQADSPRTGETSLRVTKSPTERDQRWIRLGLFGTLY